MRQGFWLTSREFQDLVTKTRVISFALGTPNAFRSHGGHDREQRTMAPCRCTREHTVASCRTRNAIVRIRVRLRERSLRVDSLSCDELRFRPEECPPACVASQPGSRRAALTGPRESPVETPPAVDVQMDRYRQFQTLQFVYWTKCSLPPRGNRAPDRA